MRCIVAVLEGPGRPIDWSEAYPWEEENVRKRFDKRYLATDNGVLCLVLRRKEN
jgi:hypothetical protein